VPSRQQPGSFYALPQSPQLFKQLLMVAGIDRYYQMARCLRDEDLRADRQYEFMQLDAEMSFADGDDVRAVISTAVRAAAEAITGEPVPEIPTMTRHHAMERYGSDKPDLRFGLELEDLSEVFAATEFRAFQGAACVKGVCANGHGEASRNVVDGLVDRAKELGAAGLVWMRVRDVDGAATLESPVVKFLSEAEQLGILDTHVALIITYMTINLPIVVWLMYDFFDGIPRELEESASLDGASRYRIFLEIVLPLARAGLVATTLLVLILSWNEYLLALFLSTVEAQTMPLLVAAQNATRGPQVWYMSVIIIVMIAPVIGLTLFLQKFIAKGLLVGAVKG